MTRKDYVLIAQAIKETIPSRIVTEIDAAFNRGAGWTAHNIADALEKDNPRFDRERFLAACGVAK